MLTSEEYKSNIQLLESIMLTTAGYVLCDDKRVGFTFLFSFDLFQYLHVYLVQYIDTIRPLIQEEGDMDDTKKNALTVQQYLLKALEDKVKNTVKKVKP